MSESTEGRTVRVWLRFNETDLSATYGIENLVTSPRVLDIATRCLSLQLVLFSPFTNRHRPRPDCVVHTLFDGHMLTLFDGYP